MKHLSHIQVSFSAVPRLTVENSVIQILLPACRRTIKLLQYGYRITSTVEKGSEFPTTEYLAKTSLDTHWTVVCEF